AAKAVLRERATTENIVKKIKLIESFLGDAETAFELAAQESDPELERELSSALKKAKEELYQLEFASKMSGEHDHLNAILEINGGAGGTEAQDWAEMLMRMYLRWVERKGFEVEEIDYQPGEVAGIKGATLLIRGDYAYGHLKKEQGVHRLVRISPFDSNARRHTSFASVSVTPEIDDEVEIEIDEKDLRIDTYRSSGAGGQHINKTDSAVRLTHIPTGIVVACQSQRSQHKNKDKALKLLKAKLYDHEMAIKEEQLNVIKGERKKIDFGSQIRSYVMHPYQMVKDLRTGHETSAVDEVLDGDLDGFIESCLMNEVR
ncbi:MAG: peptide chain release factor 2, partial [Bdellovibrionales bacterium]|nr:peptide chain release factor 2 [Bdellovibrionales bacterium]